MKHYRRFLILLLGCVLSGFLLAWGQPARLSFLGPIASGLGFAFFWATLDQMKMKRLRSIAILSTIWFASVQWVQLSWMTSTTFQGPYTLFLHFGLSIALGGQFAAATCFLWRWNEICDWRRGLGVVAAAGLWVGLEWSRLWFLCGFSWNPIGLLLTSSVSALQAADLFGIYGLSFWVFLVNGIGFIAISCWIRASREKKKFSWGWAILVLLPYLYGEIRLGQKNWSGEKPLEVALVQTGLLPSQKVPMPGREGDFIAPAEQWYEILEMLAKQKRSHWDLIVLPEATVPWGTHDARYGYKETLTTFFSACGMSAMKSMPPLKFPQVQYRGGAYWVSNAFWAQALSNFYGAELVIGLDYRDPKADRYYNSAFYFTPSNRGGGGRYDKQVLLPVAEYLPFSWLERIAARYGIFNFFSPGQSSGVFGEQRRFSLSICYEETFPHLMRKSCLPEVEMFVNLTNDGYYPFSSLPEQHFSHARVRAVENGRPLVRACNTGVTAAIDGAGRILARLEKGECEKGVLSISLPNATCFTAYSLWGEGPILAISAFFSLWGIYLLRCPKPNFKRQSLRHL